MGTEILSLFILVPIALWLFDLASMIQRKKVKKHAILFAIGIFILGYMSLSSNLGGWSPMQGFIIGSVFYGPGYLVLFFVLSTILKEKSGYAQRNELT